MVGQVILVSVVGAMVLAGILVPIWAGIDLLRRPQQQWDDARQNKLYWIVLIVITLPACAIGWVVPTIYLVAIRPKLDAVAVRDVPDPPPLPGPTGAT